MSNPFRLALAQINPTVGDLRGNGEIIRKCIRMGKEAGADLVVFPELSVCGYPPEDLLMRRSFITRCEEYVRELAKEATGIAAVVGSPVFHDGAPMNAACILGDGKWRGSVYKTELPNYGVFDERRYFTHGANGQLLVTGGHGVGISICEDIWVENDIVTSQAADGASLLVNISGSPYRSGVLSKRKEHVERLVRKTGLPFAYLNQAGGQDELVFDGRSFILGPDGAILAEAAAFDEDFLVYDFDLTANNSGYQRSVVQVTSSSAARQPLKETRRRVIENEDEEIYKALTMGVRDYVSKNGFTDVVIALSGGIDSALTAAIAVDALGPARAHGVSLPSPFSSEGSVKDANELAANLGVGMVSIPIGGIMTAYDEALRETFTGRGKDATEENIQARIRGALCMALSNKFGWLLLTTGNKSETAVGYCTLYGDMAGGLAVIKDVFKTRVYSLARWRNDSAGHGVIPGATIEKEPSAELRPGQKDTDSLPPYDILDAVLAEYIERDKTIDEIVNLGYSKQLVEKIVRMVDLNEYKRRQGPVGVKITSKAFGRDRRIPITCRFIDQRP
ncbi:MAG: NAD+ synthase [Nitrospinae bacterium]|nr:NAD+ synthase [Nitrospinota bacterium]